MSPVYYTFLVVLPTFHWHRLQTTGLSGRLQQFKAVSTYQIESTPQRVQHESRIHGVLFLFNSKSDLDLSA